MKTFNSIPLHPLLQKALEGLSFTDMTPVQSMAIPVLQEGKDLIACAQTGTGKTFAFLLPILSRLLEKDDGAKALILVPTRELASQVAEGAKKLLAFAPQLRGVLLIGGSSMDYQIRMLRRNPQIIVATPGRLIDHLSRGSFNLKQCRYLVLDEADRMLDMGFSPQLKEIVRYLPSDRQTMLFSATLPPNIIQLSQVYLREPARVTIEKNEQTAPKITQSTKEVATADKLNLLIDEVNAREGLILVFARTQIRSDRLAVSLKRAGHEVSCIHGGKRQRERDAAIYNFKTGATRILVATDIAARGIDIAQVEHVINFDLPQAPEDYVHRIGRTGRAGKEGQALSLISPEESQLWRAIARHLNPNAKQENGGGPRGGGRRFGGGGGGHRGRRFGGKPSGPRGDKPSGEGGRSFGGGGGGGGFKGRRKKFSKGPRPGAPQAH